MRLGLSASRFSILLSFLSRVARTPRMLWSPASGLVLLLLLLPYIFFLTYVLSHYITTFPFGNVPGTLVKR